MKTNMLNSFNRKKGFTIIEVVLVLAIAGMIFMMVFLGLPALQRSQRDTYRRKQLASIISLMVSSISNNKGRLISDYQGNRDLENFVDRYITPNREEFLDPATGEVYVFRECEEIFGCGRGASQMFHRDLTANLPSGHIYYNAGASCNENGEIVDTPNNYSTFALVMRMENGVLYCATNQ